MGINQGIWIKALRYAWVQEPQWQLMNPSVRHQVREGGSVDCGTTLGCKKKHGYWSRFQIRYLFHGTSWFSEELCRRCFGDLMKCLHDWSFLAPALFYILYLNLFPPDWFTECSLSSVGQVSPVFSHICRYFRCMLVSSWVNKHERWWWWVWPTRLGALYGASSSHPRPLNRRSLSPPADARWCPTPLLPLGTKGLAPGDLLKVNFK